MKTVQECTQKQYTSAERSHDSHDSKIKIKKEFYSRQFDWKGDNNCDVVIGYSVIESDGWRDVTSG